jgi:TonB family protein
MLNTQRNSNYPLAISMAIHGIIIAFFSILAVDLPKKTTTEPPIHIKNIIFENKKAAPARDTNSKRSVSKHKPTKAAQYFRRKKRAPRAQAKPLPRNPKALNTFVPVNRVPEKPNQFQKSNVQPMTPISFSHQITQSVTYVATGFKPKSRHVKNIKPKSFSNSLSVSSIEPVRMAVTNKKFSPNPLGKPMQIAAIPKGFVNDLPSEKSLAKLSQNTISGTEHGVKDSNRDDLEALRKGYSSQVWRRIVDAKFYPRTARKQEIEGKPVVEFELRSDGQLMNYLIVRSSSNKILDKAAIDAVKNASPYPGIPKLLKLNSIRFNLPISFILNEP